LDGNDRLDGGAGRDYMIGGKGNDIYIVDNPLDTIVELAGEGLDYLYTSATYLLPTGMEIEVIATVNYLSTAAISLTGNELGNIVTGNNGNNTLNGLAGNDYLTGLEGHDLLDGGAGIDTLTGGLGNDNYYVDLGDTIQERAGEGSDKAFASTNYRLNAGAEVELLATRNYLSTAALDLAGNEINNSVAGNNGSNLLEGMAGDDSLSGLDGNDILDGGAGRDSLDGGAGADTFRFTSAAHSAPGAGDRIVSFQSGVDKIDLSAIDANSNVAGDQAFTFVGTAAFTNTAGELRYDVVGSQMHIYADLNGDGLADFHIVAGGTTILGGDFIP
ncbi:calcium-binding protein, partial [Allosphingosinicella sp.]|uniref:calcium-binding protein n=1 Tax=Allosphingosinicella sp. TaxID=2823234 RepID=UPI002EF32F0F